MDAARRDVADARRRLSAGVRNGDATIAWQAALAALSARGRFGVRLGLERSLALLAELGSPERDVRGALVAGTNGKGSVVALVSAALRAHGLRHATTPKPHLVSYRERVMLDGRPLAPLPFARAVDRALGAERLEVVGDGRLEVFDGDGDVIDVGEQHLPSETDTRPARPTRRPRTATTDAGVATQALLTAEEVQLVAAAVA